MQEKAKVIAIDNGTVTVVPIDIEACVGCSNSDCKNNGSEFTVVNSQKLAIRVGSEVHITAPVKNQLSQAFLSVGVPVMLAVAAFILVPVVIPGAGEGLQVGGSMLSLIAAFVLMYRFGRIGTKDLPEISEVL